MPTTPYVGQKIRASDLYGLFLLLNGASQTVVGTCSAPLTLTTGGGAVPGCSVTATTVGANAYAIVTASVQFAVTGVSAGVGLSSGLFVDGVSQAALGSVKDSADAVHDGTKCFTWKISLPTPGLHTFALDGKKTAAGGTAAITNTYGTNIVVMIYDLP